jgi:UDPglucose 6-dehydrogenase
MSKVLIVGAGVVGKATGKGLIKKGNEVTFIDEKPEIIRLLRSKKFSAYLSSEIESNNICADISMFCVPTPFKVDKHGRRGSMDLSYISSAVANHSRWLKKNIIKRHRYHLVVIRSTVPPGTTRNILLPLLESYSGLRTGVDFGLCMQPEFLRNKSSEQDFLNPRATVIGEYDKTSGDNLVNLYDLFTCKKFRTDLETAEFMKYVHNCFNATKISFSNEMWLLGQKLGIDANLALQMASESAEGFWNSSYGITGGTPYEGPCLPKDVKGFLAFAKEFAPTNDLMPLLTAVDTVNSFMQLLTKCEKI